MVNFKVQHPIPSQKFLYQRQKMLTQELQILFAYMHADMMELLKDMKKEEIREDEFLQKINGLIG